MHYKFIDIYIDMHIYIYIQTEDIATHCNTLQYTAIHCNTLQHTLQVLRRPRGTIPRRQGSLCGALAYQSCQQIRCAHSTFAGDATYTATHTATHIATPYLLLQVLSDVWTLHPTLQRRKTHSAMHTATRT